MRYLILSDIHSNFEALEASLSLARARGFDRALCLGDLVGYGPDPNAVIPPLREVCQTIIRGNHDKACCGITNAEDFNPLARQTTFWTRTQLTAEHTAFLRQLPEGPQTVDGFEIVHGSPADEDEYLVTSVDARPILEQLSASLVLFGHTHLQGGFRFSRHGEVQVIQPSCANSAPAEFSLENDGRHLINPGSVGQPRDGDWRAAFAILDAERRVVEYYRTPYNLPKTQQKMVAADLPAPLVHRLEFGR